MDRETAIDSIALLEKENQKLQQQNQELREDVDKLYSRYSNLINDGADLYLRKENQELREELKKAVEIALKQEQQLSVNRKRGNTQEISKNEARLIEENQDLKAELEKERKVVDDLARYPEGYVLSTEMMDTIVLAKLRQKERK